MVGLLPVDVAHPGERLPGQLPVAGQLVLSHGPLVAVQGSHHVARTEQGTAAVREQWSQGVSTEKLR